MAKNEDLELIPDAGRHWESMDFTISKMVKVEGDLSVDNPRFGSTVKLQFIDPQPKSESVNLASKTIWLTQNPLEFVIGTAETEIDRRLEKAVKSMYPGEIAEFSFRIKIQEKDDKGKTTSTWTNVTANFQLVSMSNVDPVHAWSLANKLDFATKLLAIGSRRFKDNATVDAFWIYRTTASLICFPSEDPEITKTYLTCLTNMIACHFRWRNFDRVVALSSIVLKDQNPPDIKLLYRRGVAYLEKNDFKEAKRDLTLLLEIEPNNKAVVSKLNILKNKMKDYNDKMSKMLMKGLMPCSTNSMS